EITSAHNLVILETTHENLDVTDRVAIIYSLRSRVQAYLIFEITSSSILTVITSSNTLAIPETPHENLDKITSSSTLVILDTVSENLDVTNRVGVRRKTSSRFFGVGLKWEEELDWEECGREEQRI
ncbi:hypothetical protein HAX54_041927, partial [Datura stramonium]|nr:hypothetical protein [Datura stramonium]